MTSDLLADEIRLSDTIDGPRLSGREQEILTLIAEGNSAPQIAERIHVTPATVRTHLRHTYAKLSVGRQAEAVAVAFRLGLIR